MQVARFASQLGKTISKNSPAILTAAAVTGTVSTVVLSTNAAFQAANMIRDEEDRTEAAAEAEQLDWEPMLASEKVKMVWTLFIPPVATCGITVACIIGANTISSRRTAALMSAYSLTENVFKDYQEKVVEIIGEQKERKIRDEVAKDNIAKHPVSKQEIYVTGTGSTLCYETITGRYFLSDIETLRRAENDINARMLTDMYASQNDFFREIGLPATGAGEMVGWNVDKRLNLQFSSVLNELSEPCLSVGYSTLPFPGHDDLH